jgi:folate-dependent phosphoribosylglycinamide formyltransferase PurN
MRVVFFTGAGFQTDELFRYFFAQVAARYHDVHVVAVRPRETPGGLGVTLRRHLKKMRRLGVLPSLEILSSYPLQMWLGGRDERELRDRLRKLSRPDVEVDSDRVQYVETVNGADAVSALGTPRPDIIIQAGAGILREPVFSLARLATLNVHHGIAPLIRGMHSIYWGLWEDRPEWVGATVHRIDAGIDTGDVLAYAPVTPAPGERFPSLFARATEKAAAELLEVLARLESGERWRLPPPSPGNTYRSTISGWRLLLLNLKLARRSTSR